MLRLRIGTKISLAFVGLLSLSGMVLTPVVLDRLNRTIEEAEHRELQTDLRSVEASDDGRSYFRTAS